jgi:hypothetical protein
MAHLPGLVAALLALLIGGANAAGPVSQSAGALAWQYRANSCTGNCSELGISGPWPKSWQATRSAACGTAGGSPNAWTMSPATPTHVGQGAAAGRCIAGGSPYYAEVTLVAEGANVPSCPANSTSTGGQCVCNATFVPGGNPYGSACEAAATACPGMTATAPDYLYQTAAKPSGTTFCDSSSYCSVRAAMGAQNYTGNGWTMYGPFKATGTDCTPSTATPDAPSPAASAASAPHTGCSAGEVQGTVNGATVCVWSPTTSTQDDISAGAPAGAASAPTMTAGDGSGGTTGVPPGGTATRITECVGIQCTTTTTIRDSGGNIVGVNSVQTVGHPDASGGSGGDGDGGGLCEENPEIPICQTSSFSGSCASSFVCDGDAIQCAIAQDQHLRHCTMFDSTHADATNGLAMIDRTGSRLGGALGTPDNPVEVDVGGMMAAAPPSNYSTACPADVVYSTSFGTVTIPLAAACPALQLAGQIAVAFTLLSCALMLVSKGPA